MALFLEEPSEHKCNGTGKLCQAWSRPLRIFMDTNHPVNQLCIQGAFAEFEHRSDMPLSRTIHNLPQVHLSIVIGGGDQTTIRREG